MRKLTLNVSEAAAEDIIEQADWYLQQSGPAAIQKMGKAATAAVIGIVNRPRAGTVSNFQHSELRNVRRIPVRGFPKDLYQIRTTELLILRVIHGARDLESLF